jgi:LAS superfamily LD-carboxypeptidase LdcB
VSDFLTLPDGSTLESKGMLDPKQLTGRVASHVVEVAELACTVHAGAVPALLALAAAARIEGMELEVVSSFRDFERQRSIWNGKYRGERPLLDRAGRAMARAGLDEPAAVEAILLWSALPGASRHHWGTDVDVIDRSACSPGYRPELTAAEFAPRGVFAKLDAWLAVNMGQFGFFRPYTRDRGGVLPEPWHLSYAPVSVPALEALTVEVLAEAIAVSELCARDWVLARLPEIHARYVNNVDPPPAEPGASGFAALVVR